MNTRTTLILGIIAVLAFVGAILEWKYNKTTEEWEQRSKKVFPDMKSEDGIKLELKKGAQTVLCEKTDDKWRLVQPLAVRADKSEIDSIFSGLEFLDKEGSITPEKGKKIEPASYGLDKPQAEVTLWLRKSAAAKKEAGKKEEAKKVPEGEKFTLLIGNKAAVGKNVYAMVQGKPDIFIVGDSILEKLSKSANDLRDKTVIEIEKPDVEKIELAYASGKSIECAKEKDVWREVRPVADLADKEKVEGVVDKLKELRIEKDDFVSEDDKDLAKYGLDKPQATAIVYQKGAAKTVIFGKKVEGKADKIYAKRKEEPTIFALKDAILSDITKEPNDLRDKKVCRLDSTDDVNKVEIVEGTVQVVLEKKDSDWKITKPKEEKADQTSVKDFIDAVDRLTAENWAADKAADLSKFGLKPPVASITLTLKENKGIKKFLIGKKDEKGQNLYVKREATDPVLLVKADFEKQIAVPTLAFRDKLVLEFPKGDSKALTVKRTDKTLVAKDVGDNKWEMEQPIKCAADKGAVDDILYDLSYLRAKRYVAELPTDLKKYGLDAPSITATVEYEQEVKEEKKQEAKKEEAKKTEAKKDEKAKKEEKKPEKKRVAKSLLIGKEDEDKNPYAKLSDGNIVFTVESSVRQHLQADLASRDIMKFKKEDAKKISLVYPGKEVLVDKKGSDWMVSKPTSKPLKSSDADDILNTMSDLRAETVQAYSAPNLAQYGFDKPELKISVTVPEGEKILIIGKKKDGDNYFAKAGASEFVYVLSRPTVEKLMKEKPESPKITPQKKAEPAKKSEAPKAAPPSPQPTAPSAPKPTAAPTEPAKTPAELLNPKPAGEKPAK
jgi:hypothetical protein